jgi:hypothetical protein
MNCDTAIEEILNMTGRPSLDVFQNLDLLLNLIQELKDEPRDENNDGNNFKTFLSQTKRNLLPNKMIL